MVRKKEDEFIRSCVVAFPTNLEKQPTIIFSGLWSRKHIDISYRHMMRQLKKYKQDEYKKVKRAEEEALKQNEEKEGDISDDRTE